MVSAVRVDRWSLSLLSGSAVSAFGAGYFDDAGDVPGQPVLMFVLRGRWDGAASDGAVELTKTYIDLPDGQAAPRYPPTCWREAGRSALRRVAATEPAPRRCRAAPTVRYVGRLTRMHGSWAIVGEWANQSEGAPRGPWRMRPLDAGTALLAAAGKRRRGRAAGLWSDAASRDCAAAPGTGGQFACRLEPLAADS